MIILVLMIVISSVLSKCLLTVKTGNWTLLTPLLYPDLSYQGIFYKKYENLSIGTNTLEECKSLARDIWEMDKELLKKWYPGINSHTFYLQNYETVFKNANFSYGYYYDRLADRHLTWDTDLKFLVNIKIPEVEESYLIGTITKFVTIRLKNGANFSLQLVEEKTDFWTTNEPFLFLSNKSKSLFSFENSYPLFELFLNKTNGSPSIDKIIASSTDLLEIVIISVIIIIIIVVVSIGCICVLKMIKRKQTIGKYHAWYLYRKQKTREENDSGYLEVVECGVENVEQPVYDYAYSTFKHLQLFDTKKSRRSEVIYEQIS